jgi:hypothetical protein
MGLNMRKRYLAAFVWFTYNKAQNIAKGLRISHLVKNWASREVMQG